MSSPYQPTYKPEERFNINVSVDIDVNLFAGFDGAPCAAGALACGITDVQGVVGETISVVASGTAILKLGESGIKVGDALVSGALGVGMKASSLTATTPTGSTSVTSNAAHPLMTIGGSVLAENINAIAMSDGDINELIEVKLI